MEATLVHAGELLVLNLKDATLLVDITFDIRNAVGPVHSVLILASHNGLVCETKTLRKLTNLFKYAGTFGASTDGGGGGGGSLVMLRCKISGCFGFLADMATVLPHECVTNPDS